MNNMPNKKNHKSEGLISKIIMNEISKKKNSIL